MNEGELKFMSQTLRLGRNKVSKGVLNEWLWGWFLVFPTMMGLMILNIIPAFQTLYLSFFESGDFGMGHVFVGMDNYRRLLHDSQVWSALRNTLTYTVSVVPITIVLSLVLAVILNGNVKGKNIYRTIYFIPMAVIPAAVTMVWRWLYNTRFGLINYILSYFNISPIDWVNDPNVAMTSIVIIGIWSMVGYDMVLLIAGLQEIPKDFYEAADIDGASPIQSFFRITIPLVSPTLFFITVTGIIQAMQVFDVIFMIIGNTSPAYDRTVSLVYLFYNNTFLFSNQGYGSAIIMLLLAVIMVITVIQVQVQKRWVNYM